MFWEFFYHNKLFNVIQIMKKSVITDDFEKKDTIVTQTESVRQAKKNRKVSVGTKVF